MATLLLRLAGPMQSWGTDSKFEIRRTDVEPSKSGVVGLLAAALGRTREMPLDDLNKLRFGIRVDQQGTVASDYQTARPLDGKSAGGTYAYYIKDGIFIARPLEKTVNVTTRHYIGDGVFLAGFESSEVDFLRSLDYAVRNPVFHLFLGRKSYVPTPPISLGVREKDLETALREEPWQVSPWRQKQMKAQAGNRLRIVAEIRDSLAVDDFKNDTAISYSSSRRMYKKRPVRQSGIDITATEHDAFSSLE